MSSLPTQLNPFFFGGLLHHDFRAFLAVKYAPKEMVKMNEASGKSIGSGSIVVTASGESLLAVKKRKIIK